MFFKAGTARMLSLFFAFLLLFPHLGTAEGPIANGNCGDNLSWSLSNDGTFLMTGSGPMYDYWSYELPWDNYRCSEIKRVIISQGVTNISRGSFSGCDCLTSVEIADTVTSIGEYAFFSCPSLPAVQIPNGVVSIGSYAFSGCSALARVTLPSSLETIGDWAFLFCENLSEIVIPNGVQTRTYTRCYRNRVTAFDLPSSVAALGMGVFDETKVGTAITPSFLIPDSAMNVEAEAFRNISAAYVLVPDSTAVIGSKAFADCGNLQYVFFDGWDIDVEIADDAFEGCGRLTLIGGDPSNEYHQNPLQTYAEAHGFDFLPNEQFYGNG